jgi:hypothetical protein
MKEETAELRKRRSFHSHVLAIQIAWSNNHQDKKNDQ